MASAYFGYNFGGDYSPDQITASASASGSTDIELRIDLTKLNKNVTEGEINRAVEAIMRYINDSRQVILGL